MLKETPRNVGGDPVPHQNRVDEPQTLLGLHLDRKTSMIVPKIAELPPAHFEQVREGTVTITAAIRGLL